jgi:glutamate-1-semialdehyde 2,1-aminomutase
MHAAVAAAQERYVKSNPASQTAFNEAAKHLPGGNTRSTLFADPFREHTS